MVKVGVLTQELNHPTVQELSRSKIIELQLFDQIFTFVAHLKNKEFHALVIILPEFKSEHFRTLALIKSKLPQLPLFLVSPNIQPEHKMKASNYKKTYFLNSNYENKELSGVIEKMVRNKHVISRLSPRYEAHLDAQLASQKAKVLDLSQEGVRLQTLYSSKNRVGEILPLEIILPELGKVRKLFAKVIWQKSINPVLPSQYGLRFISQKDF